MKKRILTVLLAVCLVFALGTVTALADGNTSTTTTQDDVSEDTGVVEYNGVKYNTLAEAVAVIHQLSGNDRMQEHTITLTDDVTCGGFAAGYSTITSSGTTSGESPVNITVDLNGHTYTVTAPTVGSSGTETNGFQLLRGSKVTFEDGDIVSSLGNLLFQNYCDLTFENVDITATNASYVISNNCGEMNLLGSSSITAGETNKAFDVCWWPSSYSEGVDVIINTTGIITGDIEIDHYGTLTNDNRTSCNTLTIQNVNFTGEIEADTEMAAQATSIVTVIGGKFSNTENIKPYLATGLDIDEDGDVVVGDNAVAQVGSTVYTDLQAAIDAAQRGTTKTVTLLKDVSVSAAGLGNTKGAITITGNITLDGDTHTISITSIDAGATPSAINIQNSANVTLKDLTIDSNGAKHGLNINNNANVTLENVKILDSVQYAIVCNSSKLTVNGLYTQGNAWGINVDSKTAGVNSNVIINNATINEKDSIVLENSNDVGSNLVINGGTFNNIKKQGDNTNDIDVDVNGGTFGMSIITVADEYPDYQVRLGSRYSYYDDADDALNAAGTTGVVTYVGPNTTVTHDVTLYYDKDHVVTLEVADEGVIYLPSGYFDGKHIDGWDERYGGNYKPGAKVTVERDMYFTVILRNGQYNIVIDDDIKHGDVSTDVSSADKGATVYIYVDPDIGYVLDDLDVYYGANNRYSVTVSYVRAGVYKFTMPNASVYITATFKYAALPFTDVNRNQWFYDEVFYVYTNGMMEGDSATTFNPDGRMTRAMFWAVLGRIDGATITGNDWAEEARAWAMREGVSDGTNPNDYVTREQMVTMLWRYAGEKNGSASLIRYTDADKISSYAVEAMRWAIGNGIIEGMTSTTLEPQGTATRAQCAAIFMRFDQM